MFYKWENDRINFKTNKKKRVDREYNDRISWKQWSNNQ